MLEVTHLLQELIERPSVNPQSMQGPIDPNICGEIRVAEYLRDLLESMGAQVELQEVLPSEPQRPNLIARFPARGKTEGKPILLGPHMDTVGVEGMSIDPFAAEIRDGKIFGRGASDTKGPMAAMLSALSSLGEQLFELKREVHFVGFMSEEFGLFGSSHFAKHHAHEYDFALIGEPTSCQCVHAHKGCLWTEVRVPGKSAHASQPERGDNAILRATRLISALDQDFRKQIFRVEADPALGMSTLNIGTIQGGQAANIIPSSCSFTVDIRSTPALEALGELRQQLEDFLTSCGEPFELTVQGQEANSFSTDLANPFIEALSSAGDGLAVAPWFCDAAPLSAAGLCCATAGPGSIDQAHSADEWIEIEELKRGVAFYRRFLLSFTA